MKTTKNFNTGGKNLRDRRQHMILPLTKAMTSLSQIWSWLLMILVVILGSYHDSFGHGFHSYAATNSSGKNLSTPMKKYQVYDLTIYLPSRWKIDESFDSDPRRKGGSFRAIDHANHLNYPRNLEIRV
ncbi:MAG: hypothetical protein OXC40_05160, partial [Proteobacteria bacterium]|nr:hypothetical protein [Pseudomonadota bacterium]